MATTSSTLTDKPIVGQSDSGKGNRQRVAAMVAAATLGLSLLTGSAIGQARQMAALAAPQASADAAAGTRPVDVSTTGVYRWDFDESAFLSTNIPARYRVSAPNEANPDSSTSENAQP